MTIVIPPERRRARSKFISDEGRYWAELLKNEFAGLEDGTTVIINIVNGEYVTGTTPLEAHDRFSQAYGENNTFGYSFQVNHPILARDAIVKIDRTD